MSSLDQVYINAHSTGASIAIRFLNMYPERLEKAPYHFVITRSVLCLK